VSAAGPGGADDRALVTAPPVLGVPYQWVALGIVCLGIFLGVLDNSIVNVALPTLSDEFGRPIQDVIWVALAFIVVSTGLSLTMGRLGDLYGRKMLYVVGFLIFTGATAFSAAAGGLEELVGSRIVQAVGSSMTMANGAAIVAASFPPSQRGTGLGIMVATVGAGFACGPVLGGVLVEVLDWRAIFWTRAPLGLVGAAAAWMLLRDVAPENRPKGVDVPGALFLFMLLGAFTFGINRARDWGWGSPVILGAFALAAASLVVFILVERRAASPVVDLALFKGRGFTLGIAAAVLQFMGMTAAIILGPFYLVDARGLSTLAAGLLIMPMPLAMLVLSPVSGWLSDRFGSRPLTTLGLLLVMIGLGLLAMMNADTPPLDFAWRMLVLGIGTSLFSSPNTSVIMSAVPPERLGTASASQTTARTMGNAIGQAVWITLYAGAAAGFAAANGVGSESPGAINRGYEIALLGAAAVIAPAVVFALLGGQRGIRAVQQRVAESVGRLADPRWIAHDAPQKPGYAAAYRPGAGEAIGD